MSQHSPLPSAALTSLAPAASVRASVRALVGRPTRRAALAAALLLPLAACTSGASDGSAPDGTASDAGGAASDGGVAGADGLALVDPWVKAAEDGMTAAFGTLVNDTGRDLQLVAASTPASTEIELHETASDGSGGMSMQEKEGGFPIPAGGELVLEPGGNHLMLMDLTAPLQPGDEVELTLRCEDGTELVVDATVKDFAGAQEHYEPEDSSGSGASDAEGHGGDHGSGQGDDGHDEHEGHGGDEQDGHDADEHSSDEHGDGDAHGDDAAEQDGDE